MALVQNFNPWAWGTWKDRWESVLPGHQDKDHSSGNLMGHRAGGIGNHAQRVLLSWGGFLWWYRARRASQEHRPVLGSDAVPEDFEGTEDPQTTARGATTGWR